MEENEKEIKDENLYECKLRGSLKVKNNKLNCLIGDIVEFDEKEKVITSIEKRNNFLHRPLLSNIDDIGMLFAIKAPNFDITNFQKMLLNAEEQQIPAILIVSKIDLVEKEELEEFLGNLREMFRNNFPIFPISVESGEGIEELREFIENKSITITGPSGAGKSSLINKLIGKDVLEINEVSSKTKRGRHTTTESRFFKVGNAFLIDTPGFSSLEFPKLENKNDLGKLIQEFSEYSVDCKFRDCIHTNEPNCAVKENVENGNISQKRYEFYTYALEQMFK